MHQLGRKKYKHIIDVLRRLTSGIRIDHNRSNGDPFNQCAFGPVRLATKMAAPEMRGQLFFRCQGENGARAARSCFGRRKNGMWTTWARSPTKEGSCCGSTQAPVRKSSRGPRVHAPAWAAVPKLGLANLPAHHQPAEDP